MSTYIVKSGSIDISDYVDDCSGVFVIERNRNFEPVLSEITMIVSGNVSPGSVQPGDEIRIAPESSSSYPFYIGIISESKYDKEEHIYNLQIRSKLSVLQNYLVNYQTLHNVLSAGATLQQYRAVDNQGFPSVQLTWIIEKMFELLNIEINLPSPLGIIQTISFGGIDRLMQLQHLRVDENMLYAINQPDACNHNTIDADPNKRVLVPTFWDFFIWFCSVIGNTETNNIGYNLRWSTSGTPEQLELFIRDNTEITIDDDINYGEENSNIVGEEGGYSYSVMFTQRTHYADAIKYNIGEIKDYTVDGKNSISWPTNFIIMYEKYWEAAGYIVGGLSDWPLYAYPPTAFLYNKIQEAISDFDVNNFTSGTTVFTRAKEQSINLYEETSEIVQEL